MITLGKYRWYTTVEGLWKSFLKSIQFWPLWLGRSLINNWLCNTPKYCLPSTKRFLITKIDQRSSFIQWCRICHISKDWIIMCSMIWSFRSKLRYFKKIAPFLRRANYQKVSTWFSMVQLCSEFVLKDVTSLSLD